MPGSCFPILGQLTTLAWSSWPQPTAFSTSYFWIIVPKGITQKICQPDPKATPKALLTGFGSHASPVTLFLKALVKEATAPLEKPLQGFIYSQFSIILCWDG